MNAETSLAASLRALALVTERLALRAEAGVDAGKAEHGRELSAIHLVEREAAALAAVAREEYAARRERERFLDSSLLREPAWDMLLDLFIHRVGGKRITLTSAAIASKVPYGTAHRHLEHLEALGLVRRTPSETDARVQFLDLSDDGFRRIGSWLRNRLQSRLA